MMKNLRFVTGRAKGRIWREFQFDPVPIPFLHLKHNSIRNEFEQTSSLFCVFALLPRLFLEFSLALNQFLNPLIFGLPLFFIQRLAVHRQQSLNLSTLPLTRNKQSASAVFLYQLSITPQRPILRLRVNFMLDDIPYQIGPVFLGV